MFVMFLLTSLLLIYARSTGVFGRKTEIKPQIEWSLELKPKLATQRANLIALLILIIIGSLTQQVSRILALTSLIAGFSSLLLPMNYGLSEEGIILNRRLLRTWPEFKIFQLQGRLLLLQGSEWLNYFALYLPRQKERAKKAVSFSSKQLKNAHRQNKHL